MRWASLRSAYSVICLTRSYLPKSLAAGEFTIESSRSVLGNVLDPCPMLVSPVNASQVRASSDDVRFSPFFAWN
jgi:hypothetical protein